MGSERVVKSEQAPEAIGAYSQAVKVGAMVFCSGQIALDAEGRMVGGGDVAAEARQVMGNLMAVLEAAGASAKHVVKATIYLADMADFPRVNQVYGEYFKSDPPARA